MFPLNCLQQSLRINRKESTEWHGRGVMLPGSTLEEGNAVVGKGNLEQKQMVMEQREETWKGRST